MSITEGRREKPWTEKAIRTKRTASSKLVQTCHIEQLLSAAASSARAIRNFSLAFVLSTLISEPSIAVSVESFLKKQTQKAVTGLSENEALAYLISSGSTQRTYQNTRNIALQCNANVFPSYKKVLLAKKKCYPSKITVDEAKAEIPLQELLDHTSRRLLEIDSVRESVVNHLQHFDPVLVLNGKWGFDGASGQSRYKQKFESPENHSDQHLFSTTFVPLDLSFENASFASNEPYYSIWRNARPSSTRLCRPIRIQYKKEDFELLRNEKAYYDSQISRLRENVVEISTESGEKVPIRIKYNLKLTMVDGKAANAICNNKSSTSCNICRATPTQMNTVLSKKTRTVNPDSLELGLSSLHAWIRAFECILHLSYRLEVKKWQVRGDNEKKRLQDKKRLIQRLFRQMLGLLVDMPNDRGTGTTNDGNTARTAFRDFRVFSQITGIDINLIRRLYTILSVINSGYKLNLEKYEQYCFETYQVYVDNYSWFYMPVSLHKLLIHSVEVVSSFLLPIGMYSEEAQECLNKVSKNLRENHARKISRETTLHDQVNFLLAMSDPLITAANWEKTSQKKMKLTQEALELVVLDEEFQHGRLDELEDESSDEESSDVRNYDEDVQLDTVLHVDLPDYYFANE